MENLIESEAKESKMKKLSKAINFRAISFSGITFIIEIGIHILFSQSSLHACFLKTNTVAQA